MPITTRTVAKGVPPRLHDPKPKGKRARNNTTAKARAKESGSRKRSSRDDDSENDDDDTSDDSAFRANLKEKRKGSGVALSQTRR
jgi:hypothetical protein